jgi:3-phytase
MQQKKIGSNIIILFVVGLIFLLTLSTSIIQNTDVFKAPETFAAENRILFPIADAFVNKEAPKTNFGSTTLLKVDANPTKITYLKFNLQNVNKNKLITAFLKVRVDGNPSPGTQRLRLAQSNNWDEKTITFRDRPELVEGVVDKVSGGKKGEWLEFDITNEVKSNSENMLTLALRSDNTNGITYYSKESIHRPRLVIKHESVAGSNTPTTPPTETTNPTTAATTAPTASSQITPSPASTTLPTIRPTASPTANPSTTLPPSATSLPTPSPSTPITPAPTGQPGTTITASVETEPVPHDRDAADDPVIWIHPTNPSLSTVLGNDKHGAYEVYEMTTGRRLQSLAIDAANTDIRYNFPLGNERIALVTGFSATKGGLIAWRINTATRQLEDITAPGAKVVSGGGTMYVSRNTGKYYWISNNNSVLSAYELRDNGSGKVTSQFIRSFAYGSGASEGTVADDILGFIYASSETQGLWKINAEQLVNNTQPTKSLIDTPIDQGGHFEPDLEGLTIYYKSDGTGYLFASSQGSRKTSASDSYTIYQREGNNQYLGIFQIEDGNSIDGTSSTDGIDVTNLPLGSAFPYGAFVAQDGTNLNSNTRANQNYKIVRFDTIASKLGLTLDTTWDPRRVGSGSVSTPAPSQPPQACQITSARWLTNSNPIPHGTTIGLEVTGSGNCVDQEVRLNIWENDGVLNDSVSPDPDPILFEADNKASTTWVAQYQEDGLLGINDPPEYFFEAQLANNPNKTRSQTPDLQVNKPSGPNPTPVPTPSNNPTSPPTAGCTQTVGSNINEINGSTNFSQIKPGDTLCLAPGTRGNLNITNLNGTTTNPITIRNNGGKTIITGTALRAGITLSKVSNLHITGTGTSTVCGSEYAVNQQQCGIEMNANNKGFLSQESSVSNIEIDHIYIHDTSTAVFGTGITMHPSNGQPLSGIHIHHNYIFNTAREALYIGSDPNKPQTEQGDLLNVNIHHNLVSRTGFDGINVKQGTQNIKVHHNKVYETGLLNGQVAHVPEGGIQLADTYGEVFNNLVVNSRDTGIATGRVGSGPATRYYNNVIVGSAAEGIAAKENGALVFNNTVINTRNIGITVGTGGQIYDNAIIGSSGTPTRGGTATNNFTGSIQQAGFINPSSNDFNLQSGSPLIDAGRNSGIFPAFDFKDITRPRGSKTDIGAYEF